MEKNKEILLNKAKKSVLFFKENIVKHLSELEEKIKKNRLALPRARGVDREVQVQLLVYNEKRKEELKKLKDSPYFARCDLHFKEEKKAYFIGKFPYTEKNIYSWVAPIAALRFEKCGEVKYLGNDKIERTSELSRKDQYMIVDSKIKFFATESIGRKRELIYQEHFSEKRKDFNLPEIVEQMEKAQDQVIRADFRGPFVIAGPAGSGKTTLAFHRAAFLLQSPDTAKYYSEEKIIVFVQDNKTKNYFAALLPELGIKNVKITTFYDWLIDILELNNYNFRASLGSGGDYDLCEFEKFKALSAESSEYFNNPFLTLRKIYFKNFSNSSKKIFENQIKENILDRYDLTILAALHLKKFGNFSALKEQYVQKYDGSIVRKIKKLPIKYSLILVDEFQNYLPHQLLILKECIDQVLNSIIYIGDLKQKINFGAIKSFLQMNEEIKQERIVKLQKVYRNTKNILSYIKDLGYKIEIPVEAKEGKSVAEIIRANIKEEIEYIKKEADKNKNSNIGIIAKEKNYLVSV